jgi:hypothetical protein
MFLENESKMNATNLLPPPPVPPRQIKSDEKTTTPPPPTVLVKQSNPVNSCLIDNNNVNITKGLSIHIYIYSKIMNEMFFFVDRNIK